MSDYPLPPFDYELIPIIVEVPRGFQFIRFNPGDYSSCLYFGDKAQSRFDSPSGDYGVLYVALTVAGAFVETFGHDITRLEPKHKILSIQQLKSRNVFSVTTEQPLKLASLIGPGLAQLGLDNQINTQPGYKASQQWSQWLFDHPQEFDGVIYHSRHDPYQHSVALFDRSKEKMSENNLGLVYDYSDSHGGTIFDVLDNYGWTITG